MQLLNTHTRYVHENILDYAEDLLSTMPDEIDRIMFMCSALRPMTWPYAARSSTPAARASS